MGEHNEADDAGVGDVGSEPHTPLPLAVAAALADLA